MELTIKIQAPELAVALQALANSIGSIVGKVSLGEAVQQFPPQQLPQQTIPNAPADNGVPGISVQQPQIIATQVPVQQQPVQQPMQQVPTQQTAPVQQTPVQQTPVQQTVPTQAQTYTMDQLAIAATQLMDAGKREELVNLLAQFGVQALMALPKEQYGAFATALRSMGARI